MNGLIGSRSQPVMARLREKVADLIRRTEQDVAQFDQDLERAHNAHALYTAIELMHAVGHRPVDDPFCYPTSLGDSIAVVEDKAPTEQHAQRLVVLPTMARAQISYHKEHLAALESELDKREAGSGLAYSVRALLEPTLTKPPIPFLFLLKNGQTVSLTPTTLKAGLTGWPYPLNLGRHLIATGLLNENIAADCITFQLGHLVPEAQVCGSESMWSPMALSAALTAVLDKLHDEQGWRAIPGIRLATRTRTVTRPISLEKCVPHGDLGPEKRKKQRDADEQRDAKVVQNLIAAEMPAQSALNQTKLDELTEALKNETGETDHLARRLRLLWAWARAYPKKDASLRLPSRLYVVLPDPSPFDRHFPARCARAQNIADAFTDYLRSVGRDLKVPSSVQRRTEIVVSAAFFGGVASAERLRALGSANVDGAGVVLDRLYCFEQQPKEPTSIRWLPDDYTAALINGQGGLQPVDAREVHRSLKNLLRELAPGLDIKDPYGALADLARAHWQNRVPGFLYPVLSGSTRSEPLPIPALARLVAAARLDMQPPAGVTPPLPDGPPAIYLADPATRDKNMEVYRAIHAAFVSVGHLKASGKERFPRHQRRALLEKLKLIGQDQAKPVSPIMAALLAWTMHLCTHGTRWRKELKFNTIRRYVYAIDRALIDSDDKSDFFNLSDSEYEALYRQVVNLKVGKNRGYTGARLLEFHAYLSEYWFVEIPNWSFLPPDAWRRAQIARANANVLALHEYQAALKLLYADPFVDERTKLCQAALLILGYRFGLRISEALRTRYDDLFIDRKNGLAVVNVETNIYGGLKSDAATRQVPLIGALDDLEWQVLEGLKSTFEARLQKVDPIVSLFARPDAPRELIERRLYLDRIHLAMRLVSGDQSLVYHHLRHSFGSRLLTGVVADSGNSDAWNQILKSLWGAVPDAPALRMFLTGFADPRDVCLEAVRTLMGHASITTLLESYMHFTPELLHGVTHQALPGLVDHCWVYALGEPRATVRKRMERASGASPAKSPLPSNWATSIPTLEVEESEDSPPTALPALPGAVPPPDLETIDWVLQAVSSQDGSPKGVADRLRVPEQELSRILQVARRVQTRTGYDRVLLTPADDRWPPGKARGVFPSTEAIAESRKVRKELRELYKKLLKLDDRKKALLKTSLQAWESLPGGDHHALIFPDRDLLRRFMEGVGAIGVEEDCFRVGYHDSGDETQSKNLLTEMGFKELRPDRRLEPGSVSLTWIPGTLPWSYTPRLRRALFALAVSFG